MNNIKIDDTIPPPPTEIGGSDEVSDFYDQQVPFKFKRLSARKPGESWIQMVYGPSKTGKTFYAGTAGPRTLFINIGDGIETLESPLFKSKYPASREMITVEIQKMELKSVDEAFDTICNVVDHALAKFPETFDTIVLDEATALRKYALNKAMTLNTQARTQGSRRGNRTDEYVKAELGDFGVEMDMIEWFLGTYIPIFKERKKHFLMLAHERQIYGKPAKQGDEPILQRVVPGFTGKTFPDKVPAFFDDVFHSKVKMDASSNAYYSLETAGSEKMMAGVRHNGIFDTIEPNPNFQNFLLRIKNSQSISKSK